MSNESKQSQKQEKQSNLIASRLQDISNEFDKFVSSAEHPSESSEMKRVKQVKKRDGTLQPVSFDKIRDRIVNLSDDLKVDGIELAQEVISCIYDGIETRELDELAARKAHNRCFIHPDWDRLASRLSISNHQKETSGVFSEVIFELYENDLVCKEVVEFVKKYESRLNDVIDYKRDYALDYTGFQYFLKIYADRTIKYDENGNEIQGPIIERFQDLLMKVSLGIHRTGFDIDSAIETYQFYSCLLFTHASPTIFNAAKEKSQCSSCFLLAMKEEPEWPYDSITKIYETLSDCAKISKLAGGIGVSISNVRGKGTIIHSVGRPSSGIVPMCKVYNETARYVDQGRRRKGAVAIYLEPWHPDIVDFLQLKKDDGVSEDLRAKDLFYAMWIPDLFMRRVEENGVWSLIDPTVCPELYKTNSEEFEEHYLRCEREKKYVRQMSAKSLYYEIIVAQVETGTPYMLFKDHANRKSNQKNLGTIRQSNLCVSGDTRIMTNVGYQNIKSLKDQNVRVWNGFEWSDTIVKQTGKDKELMKIEFSNGATLKCTPQHKFYINIKEYSGDDHLAAFQNSFVTKMVQAEDLHVGDRLMKHLLPLSNTSLEFVKVTNIKYLPEPEDTYCFTEEKLGLGTFEGVVTGQCSEIIEYTDSDQQAVCNLASICLPRYIDIDEETNKPVFNHKLLYEATKILTRNLNKIIDINYYPNKETKLSNMLHRPIGIGIQGLADTFYRMRYPFESEEAMKLNSEISETIYFAALEASCELAEEDGAYESYEGSPLSQGLFQFDLWNDSTVSERWNWTELKENIAVHGVRNSLLVALMPTASTSFLMGCLESFEPISSNYYVSGGIVGSFKRVNKYLVHDMIDRGLWTNEVRNLIVANNGSVQNIGIPKDLEMLYKTVWEIPQKVLINLSAERGRFVCQSQSLNVYLLGSAKEDEDVKLDKSIVSKLSSLHMYAWKKGLKTGMYYLRTKAAKDAVKSIVDPKFMKKRNVKVEEEKDVDEMDEKDLEEQAAICRRDNKEDCMMCGA